MLPAGGGRDERGGMSGGRSVVEYRGRKPGYRCGYCAAPHGKASAGEWWWGAPSLDMAERAPSPFRRGEAASPLSRGRHSSPCP